LLIGTVYCRVGSDADRVANRADLASDSASFNDID